MKEPTIGQVAKVAGVGVETIRFYERQGLIERPERLESGFRRYPPGTVDRVRFVRRAKELGFTLREAAELLDLRMEPEVSCDDVRARAEAKLAAIEDKLAALARMREILGDLVAACARQGRTGPCPILAAMERETEDPGGEAKRP